MQSSETQEIRSRRVRDPAPPRRLTGTVRRTPMRRRSKSKLQNRNSKIPHAVHLKIVVLSGGSVSTMLWLKPSAGTSSVIFPPSLPRPVPP